MTNNTQIMSEARASLDGKWPLAIGTFLIILLISMGAALICLLYTSDAADE